MKRIFLFFLYLFSFSFSFGQQVTVNPSIVDFHLQSPGAAESQTITIANNSGRTQSFEISIGDWNRKIDGDHEYFSPNTKPYSCSSWISLDKNFLEIPAGGSGEITVTLQAPTKPEDLEKMKWSMLFIQGANLKKPISNNPKEAKAAIQEIIRMGIHIYQTPPSIIESSAKVISLDQSKENLNKFDFVIENTGKLMINAKGHMEITNLSTSENIVTPNLEFPVFPGGKRKFPLQLPNEIKKGKYSVLAVLDYSENASLEAIEKTIEIK